MGSPLQLFTHPILIEAYVYTAAGAVAVLEARRDSLARRVEGLVRCKNEFQELARCL